MYDFSLCFIQVFNRESYRTFHTVKVIIDSQSLQHEERCGDSAQTQFCGQILLKEVLDQLDTLFCLLHIQQSLIVFGFNQITHIICFSFDLLKTGCKGKQYLFICKKNKDNFCKMLVRITYY